MYHFRIRDVNELGDITGKIFLGTLLFGARQA